MKVTVNISDEIAARAERRCLKVDDCIEEILEQQLETQHSRSNASTNLPTTFENIAKDVPDSDWARVPPDLSTHLDHHLYRARKTY
jgi:hypothetical protein